MMGRKIFSNDNNILYTSSLLLTISPTWIVISIKNWELEVKERLNDFVTESFKQCISESGFKLKLKSHGSKVYAQVLYAVLLSVPLLHTHILSLM